MPVAHDPIASLEAWPIEFTLGGKDYTIPPQPAARWLAVMLEEVGQFEAVVELLSLDQKAQLEQDLIDEVFTHQEKEETFRDVVEAVAGRPWWMVLNYVVLAKAFWARFHGRVLMSGLDINRAPFGAYLDALHYAFIEGRDEQSLQKITNYLETPPAGMAVELDEQTEGDTFLAMMNQSR